MQRVPAVGSNQDKGAEVVALRRKARARWHVSAAVKRVEKWLSERDDRNRVLYTYTLGGVQVTYSQLRAVLALARQADKLIPPRDLRLVKCKACGRKFRKERGSCSRCYLIDFEAQKQAIRELKKRVRLARARIAHSASLDFEDGAFHDAYVLLDLRQPLDGEKVLRALKVPLPKPMRKSNAG